MEVCDGNGRGAKRGSLVFKRGFYIMHPYVVFLYFTGLFIFQFIFRQPLFLLTIFVFTVFYAIFYNGFKNSLTTFKTALFIGAVTFLINPLLVHRGKHVLFYLFGNSVTLEAVVYGFYFGILIATVIITFISFNLLMDLNRLLFVFHKILPNTVFTIFLSLRSSVVFEDRAKELMQVQSVRGITLTKGKLTDRIKSCGLLLSALITWNLEEGLQTAEILKSKGYGTGVRSFYNIYKFTFADGAYLALIISLMVLLTAFFLNGAGQYDIYNNLGLGFCKTDLICFSALVCFLLIPLSSEVL